MPVGAIGQQITFASQLDPDAKYYSYVYENVTSSTNTIQKLCAVLGQPEMAQQVLALNTKLRLPNGSRLRGVTQELKVGTIVRMPGTLAQDDAFSVTCGDNRPIIKDGYAVYDTVSRPGRVGINRFLGYNPITMDVSIQFEGLADTEVMVAEATWKGYSKYTKLLPGARNGKPPTHYVQTGIGPYIESNIAKLERMAGIGVYAGAQSGPPAVIRLSVTDNNGHIVPLIPANYQWSKANPNAPLYRITAINWADGALSDDQGNRIRAAAVVTVKQYTPLTNIVRSASQRAKNRSSN